MIWLLYPGQGDYQICVYSSQQGWGAIHIDKYLSISFLCSTPIVCCVDGLWPATFSYLISNDFQAEAIVRSVCAFS